MQQLPHTFQPLTAYAHALAQHLSCASQYLSVCFLQDSVSSLDVKLAESKQRSEKYKIRSNRNGNRHKEFRYREITNSMHDLHCMASFWHNNMLLVSKQAVVMHHACIASYATSLQISSHAEFMTESAVGVQLNHESVTHALYHTTHSTGHCQTT